MFVRIMALYNLLGTKFQTPEQDQSPPVIAETMIAVQPELDMTPLLSVPTTIAAIDVVTVSFDSWLYSLSFLPVGTGIKFYAVVLSGRKTYFVPLRSGTAGAIDLATATTFPLNPPYGIPMPTGSTITIYAVNTSSGTSIQIQYLMVSATGVP